MEIFVARQPILNMNAELYAYELLYRNNRSNTFPAIDGNKATADIIINSFLNIGIDKLSAGKPCFINFTAELLKLRLPAYFQPRDIVVEILETVEITKEIVLVCRELHELGYRLALDDFVYQENNPLITELLQYVDIIKVDFLHTSEQMRAKIEMLKDEHQLILLAEKVETREQFIEAKELGYSLFQGYFFSKPVILTSYDVPTSFQSYYQVINELAGDETEILAISELIEQDISLSHKLLKLINSPAFRPKYKIQSIMQAIVLLGMREIQKWIYVLAIRQQQGYSKQLSKEVLKLSLTRAKMCELIAEKQGGTLKKESYFLTGMLSLLDSILSMPMEEILDELPLARTIHDALTGVKNPMKDALDLVIAIERVEWEEIYIYAAKLNIPITDLFLAYHSACQWGEELLVEVKKSTELEKINSSSELSPN